MPQPTCLVADATTTIEQPYYTRPANSGSYQTLLSELEAYAKLEGHGAAGAAAGEAR